MKVQGINNQNSISHKAYFKPNAEFKKLWAYRPIKKLEFDNKLSDVKNKLPNHQLEIIDSGRSIIGEKVQDYYLVFNNITNKAFGLAIAATSVKNHLETLFESLLEKNDKTEDFFKSTWDTTDFDNITTKNF